MSIRTSSPLVCLFLTALVGCSAADGSSDAGSEDATSTLATPAVEEASAGAVELRPVAVITLAGSTIELQQAVDSQSILVSENFDLSRGSVLQRLTAGGALTSLEIFVSLQPEAAVPEVLSRSHEAEARALGRADGSVLSVTFDASAPIAKFTSASCDSAIFSNEGSAPGQINYTRKQRLDNKNGVHDLAVGTAQHTAVFTTSKVSLGVCNDSPSAMSYELWKVKPGGAWQKVATNAVAVNTASWYSMIYLGEWVTPACSPDLICVPQPTSVAYFVRGNGTNFRARTAEGKVVPQQVR